MICPQCEIEYRSGFVRCADCDVALVETLPDSQTPRLVGLRNTRSPELAGAIIERLESEWIPYVLESGTALHIVDGNLSDEARSWSARIWVVASKFDQAAEIAERVEAELRQANVDLPPAPTFE